MEGKDVLAMAQSIERWADMVTVVTPDYPRRMAAADVAQSFRNATLKTSVQVALDQRSDEALTVVCGSGVSGRGGTGTSSWSRIPRVWFADDGALGWPDLCGQLILLPQSQHIHGDPTAQ